MNNPVIAYLAIFTPVLAVGLLWGWLARGCWDKTGRRVDQLATETAHAADDLGYPQARAMLDGKTEMPR